MELTRLNSEFLRSEPVENWNSLIWTERHSVNGDFEMVSNDIEATLEALPTGNPDDPPTLVAIKDSETPCIVETHKIEEDSKGAPKITTSGRTFETILEGRASIQTHESDAPRPNWTVTASSPSDAVWYVADQITQWGMASPLDIIPEIRIINTVESLWPAGDAIYTIEPKDLHTWVRDILKLGDFGFKAKLPGMGASRIDLVIYEGTDHRDQETDDSSLDQFTKATYLLSRLNTKNAMTTQTANGVTPAYTGTPKSGLNRYVEYQDLSSEITLPAGPELTLAARNRGKIALTNRLPTAIFTGEISEEVLAGYNSLYSLGDIVRLRGKYGLYQDARISEFVRTHDMTGTKAYPAFEALMAVNTS